MDGFVTIRKSAPRGPTPKGLTPAAVLAQSDSIAWGVLGACRDLGLRVPNDVSIAALQDSEVLGALTPSLTAAD